ncbi:hypothetical protein BC629DRAFT_1086733 [Irpex lacteus]|nr:hypothetical protein BC629DRAFT_1086733 [Irpex lacteus]
MSVNVTNKVISRYFDLTSGLALCFEASGGPTLPKGGVECPDWYPASNSKLLRGLNFVRTYPASGPRIRKFCPDQYLASTPIVRGPVMHCPCLGCKYRANGQRMTASRMIPKCGVPGNRKRDLRLERGLCVPPSVHDSCTNQHGF